MSTAGWWLWQLKAIEDNCVFSWLQRLCNATECKRFPLDKRICLWKYFVGSWARPPDLSTVDIGVCVIDQTPWGTVPPGWAEVGSIHHRSGCTLTLVMSEVVRFLKGLVIKAAPYTFALPMKLWTLLTTAIMKCQYFWRPLSSYCNGFVLDNVFLLCWCTQ